MIRVAQILGEAHNGGVESCITNYYNCIDRSKVQFDFYIEATCEIVDKERIEAMGGKVIFIPHYTHVFKYVKTLTKLLKEGNYDIVHCNMNALSVFALSSAKKAGVKIRIAHSHSTSSKKEWKKNIVKNLLRPFSKTYPTHYFACSEHAGRWLFGNKAFEQGKVTIINNAIDLDRFKFDAQKRSEMRKALNLKDEVVLGHIGRFMTQKNHSFLIDVFYEYNKLNPDSKLLLLGEGPLLDETVAKVESLNLNDKVIFAGVDKSPENYYQAMDIFLLPSIYEGLGLVLIEAQASGLPAFVSTEVPLSAKVLDSTEYLNLDLGAKEWAEKIAQTVKVQSDEQRLSAYQSFVGSNYDIKSEAQRLLSIYEELLNNNK
ncbi:MAG: glycosyltransferase family 1 protein [Candidatus Coproplasma sp.]